MMPFLRQNLTNILCLILFSVMTGCNLNLDQGEANLTQIIPTTTRSGDTSQRDTSLATTTSPDTVNLSDPDATLAAPCEPLAGWTFTYEVQRGDTLTSIANRIASDITTLAEGNCLDNPNALRVGQVLNLPVDPNQVGDGFADGTTSNPWFVITDDTTDAPVSCDSFAYEVSNGIPTSQELSVNIEQALQAMFREPRDTVLGNGDFTNYWGEQNLAVNSVTVIDNRLNVIIDGQVTLFGTCADGAMEAQMLLTVFDNPQITEASIRINGQNMAQLFDMSGLVQANQVYTRADIPYRR